MNLPAGYDPEIAARLCFLSDLAYDCFEDDELNPGGSVCVDNFAFIVRHENGKTLVAFQGSDDVHDFLIDGCFFICEPDDEPTFPPVHRGFWKAVTALLEPLREELSKGEIGEMHLGGHSLGAAETVLIATRLKEMGYPVAGVYGFAPPPVGAVKFYNYYQTLSIPTFLLVFCRDAIPFLQPRGIHVAPLIYLDRRAHILDRRTRASWWPWNWSAWHDDHDRQNYLAATGKIADRARLTRLVGGK